MRGLVWGVFLAASLALPRLAQAQLVNGGFETGDYTGWNLALTQEPTFATYAVLSHGTTVDAGDFVFDHQNASTEEQQNPALPQMFFATEGSQVAVVLSNQPHVARLFQDALVPTNARVLRWEMSWINSDVAFDPAEQFLEVSVRDPVDDSLRMTLFKTAEGTDPLFVPMLPFTADLSAFAGQTVRIDVTSHFARSNGIFALDNVRFVAGGGVCGDGVTDTGEDCDDAGASPACDADCTFALCGDGTLNLAHLEACDDGNTSSADACNATCGIDSDVDSIADLHEVDDTSLETPAPDTDLDTVPDYLDNDSDADGILDVHEAGDQDPMTPPVDRDNDGTPNFRDRDADNDGVPDFIEAGDGNPVTPPFDTDGDQIPNYIDLDSDNDGVADGTDNCPLDPNPDQRDSDSNGIGDACQPPPPVMPGDTDGDGVPDVVDNCPLDPNPDQRDSDSNGIGDACQPPPPVMPKDTDGDGVPDAVDNCPLEPNSNQRDSNNNGIGDACEPPVSPEDTDAGPADSDAGTEDSDAGTENSDAGTDDSDAGPQDTDGDGVPDDVDNCPAQRNPDQRDVDDDGTGDACEVSALDAPVFGGGGGCAVARDGRSACGWAVWIALSLIALARRRPHAQLTSLVLLLATWLCAAGSARAQVGVDTNLNIDRFVPASDRDGILHVEWARVAPHLDWDASLSIGALLNPLVVRSAGRERALVASRVNATLTGSVGLWGWTQVSFALPFVAFQKGDRVAGLDYPAVEGATLGDLRLAPKLRLLERVGGVFDLGLMVPVSVPTATSARFVGEKKPFAWPQVLASVTVKSVRMSANLGYLVRKDVHLGDAVIGDELTANVGIGYRLARFDLDAGAMLAWPATGSRRNAERTYAELLVGGSYWLSALAGIFVSVGRGMTSGIGSSDFRAVVGVRLSQRRTKAAPRPTSNDAQEPSTDAGPPDTDRDGIVDAEDGCPDRAGTASADALRHGCPKQAEKVVVLPDADGHVGAVEIDDGTTTTLLDEAYATAEVSAQGTAARVAATPSAAVARALAQAELALPPADLDGDGVPDAADVCPGRAGVPSGDPLRNGCPASAERLIVLPDPDSHVGAVVIERGDQTVLVDQAYGAAEVGADGAVVKVESAPAEVVARALAEYAAALPVADADADGVPDESDACPAAAGVTNTNPLRHGCPRVAEAVILVPDEDGHVGSLEIESGAGPVVINQPFASFELGADGKAQPVSIADGALVQRNIASVASLLPRADRDGDGIIDAHDACPVRPGRIHENEKLHGCPKTLERIVLLPDDDGHVGALEVGEGDDAFTLDAAYASAEIAGDGKAVQLRTRAAAVEEDFRETFAARPDYSGARIVIYFNRRAQPTLDVSEQIEDLAADLYGRVGYSVSVVGHADATGSERRNLRIGEARAQRVAEDLIAAGVARAQVTVSSKGSSEPAVRVDDPSIPELKNRRVEIFVTY